MPVGGFADACEAEADEANERADDGRHLRVLATAAFARIATCNELIWASV